PLPRGAPRVTVALALHDALPISGRVAFTTAPSSAGQSGVALVQQPVLQLQDANGNPVSQSGVVVTATVSPAGATPSNATATTNADGKGTRLEPSHAWTAAADSRM